MRGRVDIGQWQWQWKALVEHPVATVFDGSGNAVLIFENKVPAEAVQTQEPEDITRSKVAQDFDQQLTWQVEERLDVGMDLALGFLLFSPLKPFGLLGTKWQDDSSVIQGLVII